MSAASAFLILLLLPLQDSFVRFTYCHEYPAGLYEKQCIDLKPDGTGQASIKRRGSEATLSPVLLSTAGQTRVRLALAATKNMADAQKYESKKKVANLGRKYLTLETASGTKEANFNYSDLKEVVALTTLFDGLLNQQVLSLDMGIAAQYERLSIPERLDELERQLKIGQIGDPPGLVPVLDKLIANDRILAYAREHAQELKDLILRVK
jgi:hypothetical protein